MLIGNDNKGNGTTTFTDQSTKSHNMSAIRGSPAYSNTQAPTGLSTSIKFVGASSEGLTVANHADFEFGSGNFTVEIFFYTTSTADLELFTQVVTTSNTSGWDIEPGGAGANTLFAQVANSNTAFVSGSAASGATINTWHHAALYRVTNDWFVSIDGTVTQIATGVATAIAASGNPVNIAALSGQTGFALDGYIASARITKGVARYGASNFTPPTLPMPNC